MQDNLAYVPEHILKCLQADMTGEVLHAGSSGIYLQFGQQILLLSDESWGILPIGIGVKDFSDTLQYLRLRQGHSHTHSAGKTAERGSQPVRRRLPD